MTDTLSGIIREIMELNRTAVDDNGHRWANSDMIHQACVSALVAIDAAANSGVMVTDEMVEKATRSEYEKHNEGDDYDAEPESIRKMWTDRNRAILTAALTAEPQAVEPVAEFIAAVKLIEDAGWVVLRPEQVCAQPQPAAVPDGWQPLATAPAACTLLATYFDEESAEWIVEIFVAEIPKAPFTHWQMITSPQTPSPLSNEVGK